MDNLRMEKRELSGEREAKISDPILVRVDKRGSAPHDIYIDKNEFKIGRGRDNDEIILDTMISRRHCIFRCEGNEEWIVKDFSSTSTFVNDVPLIPGTGRKISAGDIIQFSTKEEFRYVFTLGGKEQRTFKRPRMDEQILDNVITEQKTFAVHQESQRKVLKDKLQIKQKEQVQLKQQLEQLIRRHSNSDNDKEDLEKQISSLEYKIESGNAQQKHLEDMYKELLEKLENERIQFETKLNEEKQKWQEALDMSIQEKEIVEKKMKEQMEKWRQEQQAEWKNLMENRVKEEKDKQVQLLNEKTMLEEKLKETEKALKEQEAKVLTKDKNVAGSARQIPENCILLELVDDATAAEFQILDTIDLTSPNQDSSNNVEQGVFNKVNNIMDEQLTCSVCSELFINATTLNCTHTFCQYCINSWTKRRRECPVCRAPVASMNRSLVLDNFIESMMENLPTEVKDKRSELLKERKGLQYKRKNKK